MSRRRAVSFVAIMVAMCCTVLMAQAGTAGRATLRYGGPETTGSVLGDLSTAGLPGAREGSVAWRDYDGDGDQDFALSVAKGAARVTRVYRNVGGGLFSAVTSCTTLNDSTFCEGDQSAGVKITASTPLYVWVRHLTTDITPGAGVSGVDVARTGGARVNVTFIGDGHAIITQGDQAHGIVGRSTGNNGASGADDWGIFWAVGGAGSAGQNGGKVDIASEGSVSTDGAGAHGLYGVSVGGNGGHGGDATFASVYSEGGDGASAGRGGDVTITNRGSIATHGEGSVGILGISRGGNGGDGGDAAAIGGAIGGDGGHGGIGGWVSIHNEGTIATEGTLAHGILAQSLGGVGGSGGAGGGIYGEGGGASGSGASFNATVSNSGTVTTAGDFANGILAQTIGGFGSGGGGSGGLVSFGGLGATGGNAYLARIDNVGNVTTLGDNANALFTQSIGGGGGSGAGSGGLVSLGGSGSAGGNGGPSKVYNSGQLETRGDFSNGIWVQSVGGGGGDGAGSGGLVSIGGGGSSTGNGGIAIVDNTGAITTAGAQSRAIMAQSIGGGGGSGAGSGGAVSIGGSGSAGGNGAEVTVANSGTLTTQGVDATGIFAQSIGGGGGNGGGSGGIASFGGRGSVTSNGGRVSVVNSGTITTGSGADTSSAGSQAIFAQSIGGGGGNGGGSGGLFSIGGSGGGGGNSGVVSVVNTGSLLTRDDNSSAIFAQSIGGGGGNGGGSGAGLSALPTVAIGGSGAGGGSADSVQVRSDGAAVVTEGDNAHGILAQSVGGGGGNGGFAIAGSAITSPVKVAIGGGAAKGGNGGAVQVDGSSAIATSGNDSHGIVAQSIGGGGGTGGFAVAASYGGGVNWNVGIGGSGGHGGDGSLVRVGTEVDRLRGSIMTEGDRSYGILAQSIGGGGGSGGFVVTGALLGGATVDLSFGGKGGTGGRGEAVRIDTDADILTKGGGAHGIVAQSIGGGGGAGGWTLAAGLTAFGGTGLGLGGSGGPGSKGDRVDVVNGGGIETLGDFSHGILAQSIGGGGGAGGMSGTAMVNFSSLIPLPPEIPVSMSSNFSVSIGGTGGTGATADTVGVTNEGTIVTHGDFSQGIVAQSIGGGGGAGGNSIAATANIAGIPGDPSPEIKVDLALAIGGDGGVGNHGGVVDVANSGAIDTQGDGSHGILAQSIGGGGGTGGNARAMTVGIDPAEWVGITNPLELSLTANIAIGGTGGNSGNGSTVAVQNSGLIQTRGADAHGILAQSIGGGGGAGGGGYHGLDLSDLGVPDVPIPDLDVSMLPKLNDAKVVVGGQGGSSGHGGAIDIANSGTVRTLGDGSFGILAQSIGGGGGIGGVGALGDGTVGVGGGGGSAGNGGAVTIASTGTVETFGTAAHAILVQSIGGGGGIAGNVDRGILDLGINLALGQNGGSAGNGGAVDVQAGGTIMTHGDGSSGIIAQSVGGGGGIGGDLGPGFGFAGSAGGDGSAGAVRVDLVGSVITYGDASHGIIAQSAAGRQSGGAVSVTADGKVLANGEDAHGIFAQSIGGSGSSEISVLVAEGGTVQGGSGEGVGVFMNGGRHNTLTNLGTVTTLSGLGGTAIRGTFGDDLVENFGKVTGSIDLGSGGNAFRNRSDAVLEAGGTIDLGGGLFTNEGWLSLGGAATTMTTTLNGDFEQTSGGTFELTISGNQQDRLIVEGGSAAIDGTLKVVADHDAYHDGATYDIIETTGGEGGVTGSFNEVVLPQTAFLNFTSEVRDGAVRVTVDVRDFTTVATNPVERAVASHLDACLSDACGDMAHMIGVFQIAQADQVQEAFSSLSPETYDNLVRGAIQSVRLHEDALGQRMSAARTDPWAKQGVAPSFGQGNGWWLSGGRLGADQDAGGGYLAHNFTLSGAMGGYERSLGASILGASVGTTQGDVDRDNDMAHGEVNSIIGSVYGGHLWSGRTFAQGILTYANGSFTNRRDVHVGIMERIARSDHDGHAVSALVTGGRTFDAGRFGIEPFTSFRYLSLNEKGFRETGAGSADLILDSRTTGWLGSDLGVRLMTSFAGERSAFLPELHVSWNHDFGIDDRAITAAFEGDPDMTFTLEGQDVKRDGVTAGLGLGYHTLSGWKATLRYDRTQRGDYRANGVSLRVGSGF